MSANLFIYVLPGAGVPMSVGVLIVHLEMFSPEKIVPFPVGSSTAAFNLGGDSFNLWQSPTFSNFDSGSQL